mmetsp:Transcript_6071/g.12159  ORF Transcript_6071/g.12159 Transcript_6071/m.12159 type:complete len:272 (+) Transcript_6071:82-897(+)
MPMRGQAEAKEELQRLMKEKGGLESELTSLKQQLQKMGVGINDPLVDSGGFPRADVDVHGILAIRNKLIKMQNDHVVLMKQIESSMLEYHRLLKQAGPSSTDKKPNTVKVKQDMKTRETLKAKVLEVHQKILKENPSIGKAQALKMAIQAVHSKNGQASRSLPANQGQHAQRRMTDNEGQTGDKESLQSLKPFLIVDKVWEDSPSQRAGLRSQDKIIKFGSIFSSNLKPTSLKDLVSHSVGSPVEVIVRRKGDVKRLLLTPMRWSGSGLLG